MFGIDQQVQQTADAYRGKPQMLQQKYAQNQQLIDLLALQKLKSDKAEAARQMALSAGGKPPTIADQRESEALDNAKKEVVQEQAGVMQNKMQQAQAAQQKLLQSAGAPQMPGQATPQPQQPPAAGLAGLPAPNIQGMAGGGIVAFDQGGTTGEEEARRAMEERRQQPAPREEQRPSAPSGLQAGLARLTNIDPEAIRQSRHDEAAREANFNASEVANKRALDAERQNFYDRNKLAEALISGAGYTSGAGAIANMGQTAIRGARDSMQQRHAMENQLIDMGPAARALGIKSGDTGYEQGIRGLAAGVNSAVDLEKVGAMGAATGEAALLRAQTAKDAAELRAAVAREAESGRSESRATARQKVILDYIEKNTGLNLLNMQAASGSPAQKAEADALFKQLYRQTESMVFGADAQGSPPPPAVTQSQSSGRTPPPPPGFVTPNRTAP